MGVGERYLELALRFRRLAPELVSSYAGPRELAERVARAYARRWMIESDEYVDRAVGAVRDRPWPAYESCYVEGLRLCRAFLARQADGFRRLLTEQLSTKDLVG